MSLEWDITHEEYLHDLRKTCDELSRIHKSAYQILKRKERYFKIPMICIGSISGTISVGTGVFPLDFQRWVSILVGGISLSIAIIQGVEGYLKITENMSGSLVASREYKKLSEDIHLELSMNKEERCSQGLTFTRQCYERYEKINGSSPFLRQAVRIRSGASSPLSSLLSPSPEKSPTTIYIQSDNKYP